MLSKITSHLSATSSKQRAKSAKPKDANEAMFIQIRDNGCLDCGSHDFLEGPTASIAMNIKCANCGSKYNIAPMMQFAERI
jgi:DNA-directed RNA polymerase subunit RPC12/RpoP